MTLADLKTRFIGETSYNSSEGFDTKLDGWLSVAAQQHAPATPLENLPDEQILPVIILAWVSLCYARASKFVNQGDMKGAGGYGTDRNTPYYKNMDLAAKLMDRYNRLVADLENTDAGGVIHQSNLVIRSRRVDTVVGELPAVLIDLGVRAASILPTEVILSVTSSWRSDFAELVLYHKNTPGIYQDWNYQTDDGIPQHAIDADRIAVLQNPVASIKVTGITPDTINYFVVVMHTTTGKYYYSNEVLVETPAA